MTNEWLEQQGLLSIRQLWMEIQVTPKPLRLFARLHEPPIADPQVMCVGGVEHSPRLDSVLSQRNAVQRLPQKIILSHQLQLVEGH